MSKVLSMGLFSILLCAVGCSQNSGGINLDNIVTPPNVNFAVKQAVVLSGLKNKLDENDVVQLKSYLVAARDLTDTDGPNLDGLRNLATLSLNNNTHRTIAIMVVDLIERYVVNLLPEASDKQEKIKALVEAGLNGAISGLEQVTSNN